MSPLQPSQSNALSPKLHRKDIDGLRAVAVVAVIANHAFPQYVAGGFIGVDVFFVISGFLITSIISRQLHAQQFTFLVFYKRRIRRIFPALIVTLLAVLAAGWLLLYPSDYAALGKLTTASAAFMANLELWREVGYFDAASSDKPLLHLWSLGIEEQFYLLWPAALLMFKRLRASLFGWTMAITAASFLMNVGLVSRYPQAAYYWPIMRFWEISSGALLALAPSAALPIFGFRLKRLMGLIAPDSWSSILSGIGAALIAISIFFISPSRTYPGWGALCPVVGAFLILAAGPTAWFNRIVLSSRGFVFVGLVSYSLYVWHWPLLSFAHILYGTPPLSVRISLVAASFVLAVLTWKYVENPLRFGSNGTLKATGLCLALALTACVGLMIFVLHGLPSRLTPPQKSFYDGMALQMDADKNCLRFVNAPQIHMCEMNSDHPEVLLMGDSHAVQLYSGLIKASWLKMVAVGYAPPFSGAEIGLEKNRTHVWNNGLARHEAVMRFVARQHSIRVVVLGASWDPIAVGEGMLDRKEMFGRITVYPRAEYTRLPTREDVIAAALGKTVERLQALGMRVIVVEDPPEIPSNMDNCLPARFIPVENTNCFFKIERAKIEARKQAFNGILQSLMAKYPHLRVVRTMNVFCDRRWCHYVSPHGQPLYRDDNHVSALGSDELAKALIPEVKTALQNP